MKKLLYILILFPLLITNGQKIGEIAEEKPHIDFPNNALGFDLMVGEGGFGFGGFYSYQYTNTLTGFVNFSISESKHDKELERFDIFGRPLPVYGKKYRIFASVHHCHQFRRRLFLGSLSVTPYRYWESTKDVITGAFQKGGRS